MNFSITEDENAIKTEEPLANHFICSTGKYLLLIKNNIKLSTKPYALPSKNWWASKPPEKFLGEETTQRIPAQQVLECSSIDWCTSERFVHKPLFPGYLHRIFPR